MQRDLLVTTHRRSISRSSSDNFFFLVDAIAKEQVPTATQLQKIESSYNSTAEFLSQRDEFADLITQIHPHGSRQLGTMVRPRDDSRDGFDIDLIARLSEKARARYSDERGPARLLNQFHAAFQDYANAHGLELKKWDRCVTLCYADGMCADIAPVIDAPLLQAPFGSTHALIPDKSVARFESTNPRGYAKFFSEIAAIAPSMLSLESAAMDSMRKSVEIVPLEDPDEVFDPWLCRIVQVLKLHRNVSFGAKTGDVDFAPTSIFITTLTAHAYAEKARTYHETPLELLLDIVETIPTKFVSKRVGQREEWQLPNPAAPASNLAEDMNEVGRQTAFRNWIAKLVGDIETTIAAIDSRSGMDVVIESVRKAFGRRPATAVQKALLARQETERGAGRATFYTATATAKSVASRPHNFFGD
ncbi:nucleotidyltransferase domain-containing protein [Burkholderia metallica]|uniref:nucleotidyltransferase domain-containing protein n=1 Tax=Burkholderia metallica TaxID=488729 RepID=UPI00157671F7|nr:nucleotidyltransferase [Burkholderia metallica]NTZ05551.1 nucleotidyltransferase [Burkholderia metallica]